jgi:hypothetical protein
MIKICNKYYVGFNNRTYDGQKFLLAYIVKDDKLTSFDSWRDKKLGKKEIDNEPKIGFKLFGDSKRGREWFGSGRSMLYVQHPDGFVFEISVDNLVNILSYCDVIKNEFTTKMIFAHEGKNLILIPTNSELYLEAIEDTERANATKTKSVIKPSDLKIGDVIEFANKTKALYVGKYNSITFTHERYPSADRWFSDNCHYELYTSKKAKEKRHFYITHYEDKNCSRLNSVQALKIYKVHSHVELSQEDAFKLICKSYRTYDSYIPILENSTFYVEEVNYTRQNDSFSNSYYYDYPTSDVEIVEQNLRYRTCYDHKSVKTSLIWMTLDKCKVCLNVGEDHIRFFK